MPPMVKRQAASAPPANRLLARLPPHEYQRLLPLLRLVPFEFKEVLNEPRSRIDHVHFPNRGVVSAVTLMEDGTVIEVATIGNEGMVSLTAFLGEEESPNRLIVQVPGEGLRMAADDLRAETSRDSPLRRLLVRYHTAFWILMTHDRVQSDEFPLTHEFLSHMLGVRRMSVTDVLKPLQDAGLIRNRRGRVTVLDRPGLEAAVCECYRTVQETFARLLGEPVS
jgi:CRP-like cAMP-binding protein